MKNACIHSKTIKIMNCWLNSVGWKNSVLTTPASGKPGTAILIILEMRFLVTINSIFANLFVITGILQADASRD